MRSFVLLLGLFAAACGGSQKTETGHKEGHEGEHHPPMPAGVAAFHDVLAPLWHAEEGDRRTSDTCAAVATFKQKVGDLVVAPPPEGASHDEGAWRDATAALVHAVEELGTACDEEGRPRFAAAFHEVHESFHRVMEHAGGGHSH